jgi:hypothetical protein
MKGGVSAMIDAARVLAERGFASGRLVIAALLTRNIRASAPMRW